MLWKLLKARRRSRRHCRLINSWLRSGDDWVRERSYRQFELSTSCSRTCRAVSGQPGRACLGADELDRRKHRDPDDRLDLSAVLAQALLPHLGLCLRRRVDVVGSRAHTRPDRILPAASGRGRRRDDSIVACDPDGSLPGGGTADGGGDLRGHMLLVPILGRTVAGTRAEISTATFTAEKRVTFRALQSPGECVPVVSSYASWANICRW